MHLAGSITQYSGIRRERVKLTKRAGRVLKVYFTLKFSISKTANVYMSCMKRKWYLNGHVHLNYIEYLRRRIIINIYPCNIIVSLSYVNIGTCILTTILMVLRCLLVLLLFQCKYVDFLECTKYQVIKPPLSVRHTLQW